MPTTIDVEDLRVGMFIHLDGGWLSHPFPLSSFRLASNEQIATVCSLGMRQVRWSPEKSDGPEAAGPPAFVTVQLPAAVPTSTAGAAPPASAQTGEEAEITAQRTQAHCTERQCAEAAVAWRAVQEALDAEPLRAGEQAQQLARAMLEKMAGANEIGICLVADAGDSNAAHALNVTVISALIGCTLNLDAEQMADLTVGALLHDLGKRDIPERFRQAEPGFNAAELNGYRDHVAKGLVQGRRMALTAGALAVLAQHHEHVDGSGFPQRHGGERLTMAARIVAIVNRYDNLCNPGTRALALTPHEAISTLFAQGRARYDATVLNAFIRMMGVYPAGSLVQLTDERYAMVVSVNASRPLRPRVLVHGAPEASNRLGLLELERCPDLGIRRSVSPAKLPPAVLQSLDPRPRVAYYFEPLQRIEEAQALAA